MQRVFIYSINGYVDTFKSKTYFDPIMFVQNVAGGFGVAFGVLGVLAIANGLSSYVLGGSTITEKVNERVGGSA